MIGSIGRVLGSMVIVAIVAPGNACGDSLFSRAVAANGTLISDEKVRFNIGDIITVLVRENLDASTKSSTDTEKSSSVEADAAAADNTFLVGEGSQGMNILSMGELPNWKIEVENEHEGKGVTKRSSRLVMTISCFVTDVLPGGNIRILGEKRVTVNREDTGLSVSGIIRARDVSPANTIQSNQIANAVIELKGKGPLWNNERRGLFTRLLDWFSPF